MNRYFARLALCAGLLSHTAYAAEINFVVQPIFDANTIKKTYEPLAAYIAQAAGKSVELKTTYDYPDYWLRIKAGNDFDLVFDGAFYADYRIKHQRHVPLAKLPGTVSHSLVAKSSASVLDASELIGKKVASLSPPAPGGLVMTEIFPNPIRQPYIVVVRSADDALKLLYQDKVVAAIVPTPLVGAAMEQGRDIATIETSEPNPHMTITASPRIDAQTREKITRALLQAHNTESGRAMLKRINVPDGFEPATAEMYRGWSKLLEN
mgnify:CR=1 FL=1